MGKRTFDWERIEIEYRAGILSLREMADQFGVSVAYIRKKANEESWTRDLSAKIKARTDALVHKAECTESAQKTEKETVESAAQNRVNIKLSHRGDIREARKLVNDLFIEMKECGEEFKVRVRCAKDLIDSLKTCILLEAEAWDFAKTPESAPPPERVDPVEGARRLAFVLRRAQHEIQAQHTIQ